jgi:hypothetical protein
MLTGFVLSGCSEEERASKGLAKLRNNFVSALGFGGTLRRQATIALVR